MNHYYFYSQGLIFTQRVVQLFAAAIVVFVLAYSRSMFGAIHHVALLAELILSSTFLLTFFRAHRRSFYDAKHPIHTHWNFLEILFFYVSMGMFIICMRHFHLNAKEFIAYASLAVSAMLSGIALGEWTWHNTHLQELEKDHKERYWVSYKDSLWR